MSLGGDTPSQPVWFSPGWHILGHQGTRFNYIEDSGKIVWEGNLRRETTPSGSTIDAGEVGIFRIYWGNSDQPIDPDLARLTGIKSQWPGTFYIYWVEKRLGPSRTWPVLKYHREHAYVGDTSLHSPYMLDNGSYRGVNGMHALLQLLAGGNEYGLGISKCDRLSAAVVAQRCELEGLAFNFTIQNGDTVDKTIQGLLLDLGVQMPDHKGLLLFQLTRHDDEAIPVLDDNVVLSPENEVNITLDENSTHRVVFTFKDKNNRYRDNDIKFDDDGFQDQNGRWNPQTIQIPSASDLTVAQTIANRRSHEIIGDNTSQRVDATRGAHLLFPGKRFKDAIGTPFRITGVQRSTSVSKAVLDCILDAYSSSADVLILDEGNIAPQPASGAAVPDLAVTWFQVPDSITGGIGTEKMVVLRIRGHSGVSGAVVWISGDGSAYISVGHQDSASAGGPIESGILSTDGAILGTTGLTYIENGPIFEDLNGDVSRVLDLTSDEMNWIAGHQLLILENEVYFLRNTTAQAEADWIAGTPYAIGASVIPTAAGGVTGLRYVCLEAGVSGGVEPDWTRARLDLVIDGTVVWQARGFRYQLNGMIRARFGSVVDNHVIGAVAFIATQTNLRQLTAPLMVAPNNICVKTQPFTTSGNVPISIVSPICKALT